MQTNGIVGKALAGAGTAAQPAILEAMRAEIMQQRDATLNQYQTQMETNVKQPFEAEQNQTRIAAENARTSATLASGEKIHSEQLAQQKPQVDAAVRAANQGFQEGKIKLEQLKTVQDLYKQFLETKDPKEQTRITNTLDLLLNREGYGAARTTDENGMPKDVIYSKRTGATFGAGGTNNGGATPTPAINDPFKTPPPTGGTTPPPAGAIPAPAAPPAPPKTAAQTSLDVAAGFIKQHPHSSSFFVDAPQNSPAYKLKDKPFVSRDDAMTAIRNLYASGGFINGAMTASGV